MSSTAAPPGEEGTPPPGDPGSIPDLLQRGRDAFIDRAWTRARDALAEADAIAGLAAEDLERLAVASYLIGADDESLALLTRAHNDSVASGDVPRAARSAFWVAFRLMNRGEVVRGGGWMMRAQGLLDGGPDCAEHGYLLVAKGLGTVDEDPAAAYDLFVQVVEIGARFDDADLVAMGRMGQGEALIKRGEVSRGASLLDEAMIAVDAGAVSPVVTGILYCAVIEACRSIFDLRRARAWTAVLSRWCASQPDLVPYRGQCLVHRAEILQLSGDWTDAMEEVRRAEERLSDPPGQPAVGMAYYQRGELHRLRGEFAEAEEAYRRAAERGRTPEPGRALLRLAEGRVDAAMAMIRRSLGETPLEVDRARLLGAGVEIMLAAGEIGAARDAAEELAVIARRLGAPALEAEADRGLGSVLLEEGDPQSALGHLRRAWARWVELGAPVEAARARMLVGVACRELGDHDTAELELAAARRVFAESGARVDLRRLAPLAGAGTDPAAGLTGREVEVLRLVAAGRTNRQIADELVISDRTVARHVSNILRKLDLANRAAATGYAYEHDLV
jgi:ATP/maltotriose-dependent transcriptional regulator MalT